MDFDIKKITGIGDYEEVQEKTRKIYRRKVTPDTALFTSGESPSLGENASGKVFLVINPHTIELRTDHELMRLLTEKYESVMPSRYFGRGGIEIVLAGAQLSEEELYDLARLSYNLS
ncbi:hypothetical protein IJ135_01955 [Candidatus Saccharibacteria bacterium]|nr:hypothetical protein [Candidatus Saccharibacteria bacterium]